jgi:hypothetical protein
VGLIPLYFGKKKKKKVIRTEHIMFELISNFVTLFYIFPWLGLILPSALANLFCTKFVYFILSMVITASQLKYLAWSLSQENGYYSLDSLNFLSASAVKNDRKCQSSSNTVALY